MAATQKDKPRLLATARKLAAQLKLSDHGPMMRIRMPASVSKPQTDGWRTVIGDLGKNQPRLELWLDAFSRHKRRKFWACFSSEDRAKLTTITQRVAKRLWPVRIITPKDTTNKGFFALTEPLGSANLDKPILEKYSGETFFGIYDPAPRASDRATFRFLNRATTFFIEVVEAQPKAKGRKIKRKDFPRCENRKWVKAHLSRERSDYLAAQCKERDEYRCQVCRKFFAKIYGEELSMACLEAHHLKPLGQQGDKVQTVIEDLLTVCANCHRILHRMEGKPSDVTKLRAIVHKRR